MDSHKNFAVSTVASAPSPAVSGTVLDVAAGTGVYFPTPPFNVTLFPADAQPNALNAEIARVTALVVDTMTIVRAQEGTSARAVVVGDRIAATITAKTLTDVESEMISRLPLSGSVNPNGAVTGYRGQQYSQVDDDDAVTIWTNVDAVSGTTWK